ALFALWKWTDHAGDVPVKVQDLSAPANSSPEAIVTYPGITDVQILFDMGSFQINGADCKDASTSSQCFNRRHRPRSLTEPATARAHDQPAAVFSGNELGRDSCCSRERC